MTFNALVVGPEQAARMMDLALLGWSHNAIAADLGLARSTVTTHMKRRFDEMRANGQPIPVIVPLKRRAARFPEEMHEQLIALYRADTSIPALARAFPGQTRDSVRGALRRLHLRETKRAPVASESSLSPREEERIRDLARRGLGLTMIAAQIRRPYRMIETAMHKHGLMRMPEPR